MRLNRLALTTIFSLLLLPGAAFATTVDENANLPFTPAVPEPAVFIPGYTGFSTLQVQGEDGNRYVDVPYIAEYIVVIYRWALGVMVTLAMVMIVVGGFQWATAAGNAGRIGDAKTRITNAVMGLLLAFGSYTILFLINPELVNFRAIRVDLVRRVDGLSDEALEELDADGALPGDVPTGGSDTFITVDESRLVRIRDEECVHTNTPVDPVMVDPLRQAARIFCRLRGTNTGWSITGGGFRSAGHSMSLWLRRCLNKAVCTTATGAPLRRSMLVRDGNNRQTFSDPALRAMADRLPYQEGPYSESQIASIRAALEPHIGVSASAGHGRGLAIDIYCRGASPSQGVAYVPCQLLLEQAMKEAGFCRIPNEWWHFELASHRASSGCDPNWTIGNVTVQIGQTTTRRTYDYRSCTGRYHYSRARAGTEPCVP